MNCVFKSFSTLFQSYKADGMIISNGCLQWLVGCVEFNGHLRQYFSLYRGRLPERKRKEKMIDEMKISKQPYPHLLQAQ